jgi:hypothetical protein
MSLTILKVTLFCEWIETRLDKGAWFRRFYVILATFLTWKTTLWCFAYATANAQRPGLDVAAVITAVSAVPGVITAHAFKMYLDSR